MNHKYGFISYTFAAMASMCLVGGLLVLSGGEPAHADVRGYNVHD